jgi:hypothetical protein
MLSPSLRGASPNDANSTSCGTPVAVQQVTLGQVSG